jgi:hypothetical protein
MSFWSENFYKLEFASLYSEPDGDFSKASGWSDENHKKEILMGYVISGDNGESSTMRKEGILRIKDFSLNGKNIARVKIYCRGEKLIVYSSAGYIALRPAIILGALGANPSDYVWVENKVSGRYYNGYSEWGQFDSSGNHPYSTTLGQDTQLSDNPSDYPQYFVWDFWYDAAGDNFLAKYQGHFEKKGVHFYYINWRGWFWVTVEKIEIWYWEAKIDSLSSYWATPNEQKSITASGVGFKGYDAGRGDNKVKYIKFIGQQGQGTYTLTEGIDFTVTQENSLTFTTPALSEGSYKIQFIKELTPDGTTQVTATSEVPQLFYVGNLVQKEKVYFGGCFEAKKKDGTISKTCYAPIDSRTPNQFYSGKILNISSLNRSIEDESSLIQVSDINVSLSNADKEFSKLLASYYLRNQNIELLLLYRSLPWHFKVFKGIIDDYDFRSDTINLKAKDFTQKYFSASVVEFCLESEFPNIDENEIGAVKPIIYGNLSRTNGAIRAILVDTTQNKYLISRTPLYSFDVYVDGTLKQLTTDYEIEIDAKGQTFIKFNSSQQDKDVTINAKGIVHSEYNSSNGYIQNPAYIVLHFLRFFTKIPDELIDFSSFDSVAQIFENRGFDTVGAGAIVEEKSAEEILQEMLTTFGFHIFFDKNGILKAEIKDISTFSQTETMLWTQIDAIEMPNYDWRVDIVNKIIGYWKYNFYEKGFEKKKIIEDTLSQDDIDKIVEKELKLFWTDDDSFAEYRITEELQKRRYGVKRIILTLPIYKLGDFDILTNFKLQDPFAPEPQGQGWKQRYFYIESIEADFQNLQLRIIARDLSYILRQYIIFGSENSLPSSWAQASEEERIYFYFCDENTGKFSDGEPGKRMGGKF